MSSAQGTLPGAETCMAHLTGKQHVGVHIVERCPDSDIREFPSYFQVVNVHLPYELRTPTVRDDS